MCEGQAVETIKRVAGEESRSVTGTASAPVFLQQEVSLTLPNYLFFCIILYAQEGCEVLLCRNQESYYLLAFCSLQLIAAQTC